MLVWNPGAELGEGPVWDAARRAVWFIDIKGRTLHRYGVDLGDTETWTTPDQTGFALPAANGSLSWAAPGAGGYRYGLSAT